MKRLKNKVFYTIFSILMISQLSFIVIFNIQNYIEQKNIIKRNLDMAINENRRNNPMFDNNNKNIRFMDNTIYSIKLDSNNNISEIINHSNNEVSENDIKKLANNILKENKKEKIGFLYFDQYSYKLENGKLLVIANNNNIQNMLLRGIRNSLIIFTILTIIFIYISKLITNWITKPVMESFNKQKDFIYDASHELKTPLAVIMANISCLRDNPKEIKWLNNIENESTKMNELIKKLLTLAKTEREEYSRNNGNLSKVVELSSISFEAVAFEKGITLKYDIQNNINFNMNDNDIKELISILLDNAIKHSYDNEIIKVNLRKENNNIILEVINKGDEIKKEDEEKIFERFYRVDKARTRNENRYGLGLSIAKNIVINHHGKITASSKNNITTFKVIFKV